MQDEKNGWIYWLGFFASHGRLQPMAPTETRQPTTVTDFKSVAGKWQGPLIRDHYFTQSFDRATLIIGETGACESAIVENQDNGSRGRQ